MIVPGVRIVSGQGLGLLSARDVAESAERLFGSLGQSNPRANQASLLNFRPVEPKAAGETGELVYLRLMDYDEPRHVSFHVITLERRPETDEAQGR